MIVFVIVIAIVVVVLVVLVVRVVCAVRVVCVVSVVRVVCALYACTFLIWGILQRNFDPVVVEATATVSCWLATFLCILI